MDALFGPARDENGITQVRLISSMEELRASGCDWKSLRSFIWSQRRPIRIIWVTEVAYLCRGSPLDASHWHHLEVTVESLFPHISPSVDSLSLCSVTGDEPTQAYEWLFQLLAQSFAAYGEVTVCSRWSDFGTPPFPASVETLALILDKLSLGSQERLKFERFAFSQQHYQQLALFRGSIGFENCLLPDKGRSIFDNIRIGQGPTELSLTDIGSDVADLQSLSRAISKTTTLRGLCFGLDPLDPPEMWSAPLFNSFRQNGSLVKLEIDHGFFTEQNWADLCAALGTHPTLEEFSFFGYLEEEPTDETRVARALAVVDMIRDNGLLHSFETMPGDVDERILEQQIRPGLKINLYRLRLKALLAEESRPVQLFAFDRALTQLSEVQENPSLRFVLLAAWSEVRAQMDLETEEEQQQNAAEMQEIQDENDNP